MAITLKADNRQLTQNTQFSYLSNNYASGVTSFVVTSVSRISAGDYLLFGEFGSEQSEILLIDSITEATRTIVTTTNSAYPHPQDTKITVLNYNQVKFYRDTVSTGATAVLQATQNIDADSFYSTYYDSINTTGYGFFAFYKSTATVVTTTFSNPIPYTDFAQYSVRKIVDSFFSMLNNSEQKLISSKDAFLWLNEAYNKTTNDLNLVNTSYTAATADVTLVANTAEYDLESDFSDVISITQDDGTPVNKIDISKVAMVRDGNTIFTNDPQYYLIGAKIGFVPTPTEAATITTYYKKKAGTLDSYDDEISFPDNQFYLLVNYMLFRSAIKLNKPNPQEYLSLYNEEMNNFKLTSHKQNNKLDSWGISSSANV